MGFSLILVWILPIAPNYGFWGLVVLMNWQMVGYMMIIYIAGIQGIPTEIIEAAKIDGANAWQTLKNITIPSGDASYNDLYLPHISQFIQTL